ncbi:tripartite tricarboxylate transporter TctB family protein [Cohaesibacter celericrescens]|uniref:tripartite tricarboxylate transporter TctB family protein n=1 Tax=Cohaesibacter celericrescens TaxID=2067669 RepID=UPI0015E0CA6E|nr:tripartite tricarboxylate transporter TctB family protein [Cohaesibacter celericrescens]
MKYQDICIGTVFAALGVGIFILAGGYSGQGLSYYGPSLFPQVVCGLLIFSSFILVVQATRGHSLPKVDSINGSGFMRLLAALGVCGIYLYCVNYLGFVIATCVFLYALMTLLGARSYPKRIFGSLATTLAVWSLFRFLLYAPLPEGVFPFSF